MKRPENPNDEGTEAYEAFEVLADCAWLANAAAEIPASKQGGAPRRQKLALALKKSRNKLVKEYYPGAIPRKELSAAITDPTDAKTKAAVKACMEMFEDDE